MNSSNRPITSREYKLMLNADRFKDREEGIEVFLRLIEFLIKKEGGAIKKIQNKKEDEEIRLTSYLDTPELALRQQGYSLRLRDEAKRRIDSRSTSNTGLRSLYCSCPGSVVHV